MSTWATLEEAIGITHESDLVQADVDLGEETIQLYCGRIPGDTIRSRDLHWLKRAVAWQTVWQVNQPGYKERSAAKEVHQDGTRVIYAHAEDTHNPAVFMLAPNAWRSLKNCSWMGTRSQRWRQARPHRSDALFPFDYKSNDNHPWEPM